MTPFHKSLRWRLQAWHGVPLAIVLAGFAVTAYQFQEAIGLRRVDMELERRLGVLLLDLSRSNLGERASPAPPPAGERMMEKHPDGTASRAHGELPGPPRELQLNPQHHALFGAGADAFYYVIWKRDGRELSRSAASPADTPAPRRGESPPSAVFRRQRGALREAYRFTPPGECLLVGHSLEPEQADLRRLAGWLTGFSAAVLVGGLAVGWWLAGRALRPIRDISAAAARIAGGDLAQRIDTRDTASELGQLANVLNSTFARLEASFEQETQFTADAAHELRTPVTVILTHTQSALSRERPATEYREALEACRRAAQRMRRLIEALLMLARLDAGERPSPERVDLALVTGEVLEQLRPLATERSVRLVADLAPVACAGDADQLGRLITNLVSNAIHYNRPRGEVRVALAAENGLVRLSIADNGLGIGPDDLPHIFDRFYRADKSRASAEGRAGLGLAICKSIVALHGGTIEAASQPGVGTTFIVRLPAEPGSGG